MKRFSYLLAIVALAIFAAFAAINWSTLMASAPLDLFLVKIQAPLGVLMLGVTAALFVVFSMAYLSNQVGSLLETRRLRREIQRIQDIADKAEESRIEGLRQLIIGEFRSMNERLDQALSRNELVTSATGVRQPSIADLVLGNNGS